METLEMNLKLVKLLNEWDPFEIGEGNYETEIADVIQAVHLLSDEEQLGTRIQSVYDFSFEQIIPIQDCLSIARKLLSIKNESSCSI